MTSSQSITLERARQLVAYCPETGIFTWKLNRRGSARAGAVAGCDDGSGYWRIGLDRGSYLAHRLAWLFAYGDWPAHEIDHRNGVRSDNRVENLRSATKTENMRNRGLHRNSTTGVSGVHFDARKQRYRARIKIGGANKSLGFFKSLDDAAAARQRAEQEHFGAFWRAGDDRLENGC